MHDVEAVRKAPCQNAPPSPVKFRKLVRNANKHPVPVVAGIYLIYHGKIPHVQLRNDVPLSRIKVKHPVRRVKKTVIVQKPGKLILIRLVPEFPCLQRKAHKNQQEQ